MALQRAVGTSSEESCTLQKKECLDAKWFVGATCCLRLRNASLRPMTTD